MRLAIKRLAAAAAGFGAIFGGIYYFAWTASISGPIQWDDVLSIALFMAPVGLMVALFVDE